MVQDPMVDPAVEESSMEWLVAVPQAALWFAAGMAFFNALARMDFDRRGSWWGRMALAVYIIQVVMCVVGLIVIGLV